MLSHGEWCRVDFNVNPPAILLMAAFLAGIVPSRGRPSKIVRVYADRDSDTHVILADAKEAVVRHRRDQVGIDQTKIEDHQHTAGWVILYQDPSKSPSYRFSDIRGSLVIWRNGKIVRTFDPGTTIWSWAFVQEGNQVAYHSVPLHGERSSHCELRDVDTGRLLALWDGDLEQVDRPEWTKGLDH